MLVSKYSDSRHPLLPLLREPNQTREYLAIYYLPKKNGKKRTLTEITTARIRSVRFRLNKYQIQTIINNLVVSINKAGKKTLLVPCYKICKS